METHQRFRERIPNRLSTFARESSRFITNWSVLEDFSNSDHRYIKLNVDTMRSRVTVQADTEVGSQTPHKRWAYRKIDAEALGRFLSEHPFAQPGNDVPAERAAAQLGDYLTEACNSCMPPSPAPRIKRKPCYWWSMEISDLRTKALKAKRAYTRARRRDPVLSEALRLDFRANRMALVAAIRAAREKSWNQLCNAVENDPWGLPYRVVTKKMATHPPGAEARGREMEIAGHLFPQLPTIDWSREPMGPNGVDAE